jgi:hypothetical protein
MCWADRIGMVWAVPVGGLVLWGTMSVPPPPPSNPVSLFLLIFGPWLLCRALDFICGGPWHRGTDPRSSYRRFISEGRAQMEAMEREMERQRVGGEVLPPVRDRNRGGVL